MDASRASELEAELQRLDLQREAVASELARVRGSAAATAAPPGATGAAPRPPRLKAPARPQPVSAVDGRPLECTRPDVCVTFLLALPAALRWGDRKELRRINALQHRLRGVDRVVIHAEGRKQRTRRRCREQPRNVLRRPRQRRFCIKPFFAHGCHLENAAWVPLDHRVYIELRAWDVAWIAEAILEVSSIIHSQGVVENVWLLIDRGVLAWICRTHGNGILGFCFEAAARDALAIDHRPLMGTYSLVLVEYDWTRPRSLTDLTRSTHRFISDAFQLEKVVRSMRCLLLPSGYGAADDFLFAVSWGGQACSALSKIERHFGVMFVTSHRWLQIGNRLSVVGSTDETLCAASHAAFRLVRFNQDSQCPLGRTSALDRVLESAFFDLPPVPHHQQLLDDPIKQYDLAIVGDFSILSEYSGIPEWVFSQKGWAAMNDMGVALCSSSGTAESKLAKLAKHRLTCQAEADGLMDLWRLDRTSTLGKGKAQVLLQDALILSNWPSNGCDVPDWTFEHAAAVVFAFNIAEVRFTYLEDVWIAGNPTIVRTLMSIAREALHGEVPVSPAFQAHDLMALLYSEVVSLRAQVEDMPTHVQCSTALGQLMPILSEISRIAHDLPSIEPTDEPRLLPVLALRFTHCSVNANLAFGEDHDNRQESIFRLFDCLFRGHLLPADVEPLHVFLHAGPDGNLGLYSRNNRRLMALLMLQAVRRDQVISVPCRIYRDDDQRPAPTDPPRSMARWFSEGYDAPGAAPNCTGLGHSIHPRIGRAASQSQHRGYPLFGTAQTAIRALSRACARERSRPRADADAVQAGDLLLQRIRPRRLQCDEETLTFHSEEVDGIDGMGKGIDHAAGRGKGKGKWLDFGCTAGSAKGGRHRHAKGQGKGKNR